MISIIEATRAHYAALQHKAGPDRTPLDYQVIGHNGNIITAGTIHVKAGTNALRAANLTKLRNRLRAMYPFESKSILCKFRKSKPLNFLRFARNIDMLKITDN